MTEPNLARDYAAFVGVSLSTAYRHLRVAAALPAGAWDAALAEANETGESVSSVVAKLNRRAGIVINHPQDRAGSALRACSDAAFVSAMAEELGRRIDTATGPVRGYIHLLRSILDLAPAHWPEVLSPEATTIRRET